MPTADAAIVQRVVDEGTRRGRRRRRVRRVATRSAVAAAVAVATVLLVITQSGLLPDRTTQPAPSTPVSKELLRGYTDNLTGGDDTLTCVSSKWCVGVDVHSLTDELLSWNGARWSVMPVAGGEGLFVRAATCSSPRSCLAVGSAATGSNVVGSNAFAWHWNGAEWIPSTS